jgi:alkanesulfonate monooxygenase SsuD/methylene tetrahydromethanopterin reductase-like flavin-dependent oxidoreductase (luciferase family)
MSLKLGLYLNSQHPEDEDAGAHLRAIVEQVRLAERLGFDSVWAGEHHVTPGYHFFPQLALLSHLAAYSGDMTLGTNLVLLPLHPPVDIAEQVALIDQLCGGRFILTVGQGYRVEEFDAFGSPYEDRLARFIDGIDVIRRLWTGERVEHQTPWYSLSGATVRPLPVQPGGVPIWIGATSDRAIKRAGRMADAFMAMPNATSAEVRRQLGLFAAERTAAGRVPAAEAGRLIEVFCHRDGDEARRRCAPHLLTKYAAYASWGLQKSGLADAAAATEIASDDDQFAALAEDRFVIGEPDEVVDGLVAQHREVGLTHLAMRVTWPGSDVAHALDCIELLGTQVLPKVRAELA